MSWNYRVTRDTHPEQGSYTEYAVREVYYDDKGDSVKGWTQNPVSLTGETPEDIAADLSLIATAFTRPVLDISDEDNPHEVTQ